MQSKIAPATIHPSAQSPRAALAAISLAALLACGPAVAQGNSPGASAAAYAPGRILVMPRAGLPDAALARILNENGGGGRGVGSSCIDCRGARW